MFIYHLPLVLSLLVSLGTMCGLHRHQDLKWRTVLCCETMTPRKEAELLPLTCPVFPNSFREQFSLFLFWCPNHFNAHSLYIKCCSLLKYPAYPTQPLHSASHSSFMHHFLHHTVSPGLHLDCDLVVKCLPKGLGVTHFISSP